MNLALILASFAAVLPRGGAAPPSVGEKAPDFKLSTSQGKSVRLSEVVSKGSVILVILHGCRLSVPVLQPAGPGLHPEVARICRCGSAPGSDSSRSPQNLDAKANEFLADKKFPDNFDRMLDPGYVRAQVDASCETAHPSRFSSIDGGVIFFSKIAKEHGGRTTAAELLEAMMKPSR